MLCKNNIFIVAIIILLITGCSKDDPTSTNNTLPVVQGWKWVRGAHTALNGTVDFDPNGQVHAYGQYYTSADFDNGINGSTNLSGGVLTLLGQFIFMLYMMIMGNYCLYQMKYLTNTILNFI